MESCIEFEQKYLFDPRDAHQLMDIMTKNFKADCRYIRQYYELDGNKFRYRNSTEGCYREKKMNIPLGAAYSASSERSAEFPISLFDGGFNATKDRLEKYRFTAKKISRKEEFPHEHVFVLDVFVTKRKMNGLFADNQIRPMSNGENIYAIIGESETILTPETNSLNLDFRLPLRLQPYLVLKLDNTNPEHAQFGSKRLCDRSASIASAISRVNEIRRGIV